MQSIQKLCAISLKIRNNFFKWVQNWSTISYHFEAFFEPLTLSIYNLSLPLQGHSWRHDIQHNDTRHNDIQQNDSQHKGFIYNSRHSMTHYHYAECHYA